MNEHSKSNEIQAVRLVDPIDRYSAFIVRGVIIGTGALGLALFLRNSKLFAVFQNVKQIPQEYYQKGLALKGIVHDVEPNGILRVEHRSRFRLPKILAPKKKKFQSKLNLRLAGLDVSPVGIEHLRKNLKLRGTSISFSVIKPAEGEPDIADADVTAKKMIRRINLNTELIRKGFARTFTPDNPWHRQSLQSNPAYSRLITRLLTCERVAEQRGLGIWQSDSWVERVRSYPTTAVQMFKQSTPTKLALLCFSLFRDLCVALFFISKQLYYIGIELFNYGAIGYRVLARGVDKASVAYVNTKRQLEQFGKRVRTDGAKAESVAQK